MECLNGTILQSPFITMAATYEMNSDFAYKMRKKLIRSKHSSCSLCGLLILSILQGCKMNVLNGPILKAIPWPL